MQDCFYLYVGIEEVYKGLLEIFKIGNTVKHPLADRFIFRVSVKTNDLAHTGKNQSSNTRSFLKCALLKAKIAHRGKSVASFNRVTHGESEQRHRASAVKQDRTAFIDL